MLRENKICQTCGMGCEAPCAAFKILETIYRETKIEEKTKLILGLRKDLDLIDYEVAEDLKELGDKVINKMPDLSYIIEYGIKIGYVRSYEAKKDKGKQINAECRKVSGTYTAYLPFDFIITFYEPNIYYMTENQKKILMLHELKHIGIGEKGFRLENHDIEDFSDILLRYGIEWNRRDQDVPDILAGGDVEKQRRKGKKK